MLLARLGAFARQAMKTEKRKLGEERLPFLPDFTE